MSNSQLNPQHDEARYACASCGHSWLAPVAQRCTLCKSIKIAAVATRIAPDRTLHGRSFPDQAHERLGAAQSHPVILEQDSALQSIAREQPFDSARLWVSINDAAALVCKSRRTIYNWLATGKLRAQRTAGGGLLIYAPSLFRPGPSETQQVSEMLGGLEKHYQREVPMRQWLAAPRIIPRHSAADMDQLLIEHCCGLGIDDACEVYTAYRNGQCGWDDIITYVREFKS